jgi:sarcosine oxidase, subunit beta
MSDVSCDVLIVGGGIQGCAIALHLARTERRVVLIDKGIAGRQASGVNAGGLRLLLRDVREYPLSRRAMEMWGDLPALVGDASPACEVRLGTGQIAVAMDAAEWGWCQARAADMRQIGDQNEVLVDAQTLRTLLPGVSDQAMGGLISQGDGHANPAASALAFRRAAEVAGARIIEHCGLQGLVRITGGGWRVDTERGQFSATQVVNCAGAWGAGVAAMVGEVLPLEVLALSMMVTSRVQPFVTPVVIGIDRPLSFKQSAAGSLVIGGGIAGKACLPHSASFTVMDRMTASAAATIEAFPALASISILRTWTGLEGKTPDGIPYIGPSVAHPGLWHVFGFCGHGFQLAPAVGEVVARALITGAAEPMLAPFAPDRCAQRAAA